MRCTHSGSKCMGTREMRVRGVREGCALRGSKCMGTNTGQDTEMRRIADMYDAMGNTQS